MDLAALIQSKQGTVIDVRSYEEFKSGHVAHSINIPLQEIPYKIADIKKLAQPIIVCCASGNRSGQAKNILMQHELICYNGGSWLDVQDCLHNK
jgi:rhodanese-related sulfurtransferase